MNSILDLLSQGWLGTIVGILGILLAIFFYLRSKKKSKLAYQRNHVSLIGGSGAAFPDEVEVRFSGSNVPRISASTIVIWNCGDQTIRGVDIVSKDPVRFEVPESDRILKYSIIKQTRDVNGWSFEQPSSNKLNVTFEYLDPGDGISLELIHTAAGPKLNLQGTIKGIPSGFHNYGRTLRSIYKRGSNRILFFSYKFIRWIFIIGISIGIVMMLFGIFNSQIEYFLPDILTEERSIEPNQISWFYIIIGFLYASLPAFLLWSQRRRYPIELEPNDDEDKNDALTSTA